MIMPVVSATLILSSPWMLGFLAVITVPWLIALRARPAAQQIGLATTGFVLVAARQQSRWRRSTRWLVPLLRSLLVAAVVIAAAGPRWQPMQEAPLPPSRHRVVILDDAPAGHASAAVAAAIASVAESAGHVDDSWPLNRITSTDAAAGQLPDDTGLVVLSDGTHLPPFLRLQLTNWTVRGGRLLVLLGPASTPPDTSEVAAWLNETAGVRVGDRRQRAGETVQIPATRPGGPARMAGPSVHTHAALHLQPRSGGGHALAEPRVLLETKQSEPLLVIRGVGQGCVAISAVPWSVAADQAPEEQSWTDLPAWPVFPDVVDGLLTAMAATAARLPPAFGDGPGGWWPDGNLAAAFVLLALGLAAAEAIAVLGTGQGRAER